MTSRLISFDLTQIDSCPFERRARSLLLCLFQSLSGNQPLLSSSPLPLSFYRSVGGSVCLSSRSFLGGRRRPSVRPPLSARLRLRLPSAAAAMHSLPFSRCFLEWCGRSGVSGGPLLSSPLGLVSFLAAAEREQGDERRLRSRARSLARAHRRPGKRSSASSGAVRKARSLVAAAVAMAQAAGNSGGFCVAMPPPLSAANLWGKLESERRAAARAGRVIQGVGLAPILLETFDQKGI